jgi:hypothetical protein
MHSQLYTQSGDHDVTAASRPVKVPQARDVGANPIGHPNFGGGASSSLPVRALILNLDQSAVTGQFAWMILRIGYPKAVRIRNSLQRNPLVGSGAIPLQARSNAPARKRNLKAALRDGIC